MWDALPHGLFLGGAPFNVACHLQQLDQKVSFVSRIGADELGKQARSRVAAKGISCDLIQIDSTHPTGIVNVDLTQKDNPVYTIEQPAAWDFIDLDNALEAAAKTCDVLVFGSLAQRHPQSRETVEQLRHRSKLNVFDVNLRPPFDDQSIVRKSLEDSQIVKMNESELQTLAEWFGLPAGLKEGMVAISQTFDCQTVCVTCGADGSALLHNGEWIRHPGFRVDVKDTIGAGDSFLAALLTEILADRSNEEILSFAGAVGAFIATQDGATAKIDFDTVRMLQKS